MMDPLLQLLIAVPLAILFIGASQHKRADMPRFRAQFAAYGILPEGPGFLLANTLPWLELLIALALLIPASRAPAGLGAAALLTVYAVAMLINVLRGHREIDCGCGGPAQPLSGWLVLRNTVLATAAMALLAPTGDRLLGTMDAFALLMLSGLLSLVYLAMGQLLHNRAVLGGWSQ